MPVLELARARSWSAECQGAYVPTFGVPCVSGMASKAHCPKLTTTTAPVLQRDTCTGTPRPYRYIVSGMTPWIVEGPESHTRALTPPHASVYRRVCVGSNPPSQPAPRRPGFIGLRFGCGGGFVSGFFQGGLGHMRVPRSPNFRGNRA